MPRFAFGKRRSTAEGDNEVPPPSFRVLDRSEVAEGNGKSFDGGVRLSAKTHVLPRTTVSDISYEDNIFADLKPNTNRGDKATCGYRADSSASGSGSTNTTKTNSTDNSSRHSNASTTPSSADLSGQEDWRLANNKKSLTENLIQSTPKPTSFLKSGRSWSFGGSKKHLPPLPAEEAQVPDTPPVPEQYKTTGRARATTSSTDATITPQLNQDIGLDLGGSFSKMFSGFDKRASTMTLRDENGRQVLQPSAMTGGRVNAPSPIQVDRSSKIEAPQHSWASHRSNDNLLSANENAPPPVPKHGETMPSRPEQLTQSSSDNLLKRTSAIFSGRRKPTSPETSESDDLDSSLLAVNRFMSDGNSRSPTPIEAIVVPPKSPAAKFDLVDEDDNLFDNVPLTTSRLNTPRQPPRKPEAEAPSTQTKVMTPSEFERYRKDKEVESRRVEFEKARENIPADDDDEDHYEDEEDEIEKSRQVAKQRRKQEAHMSVYRQQMMKVTGESADAAPSRPSMSISFSTPNLTVPEFSSRNPSDASEEDEEVPLAILAAHGFPNKNRPPARLSTMMSNPNLRQASQPSYQRPGSAAGHGAPGGAPLPPFARGLPQDPYGLVNPTVRESFALGGGVPAGQNPSVPPGGLVGVIASEERARSMRRGSPQVPPMEGYHGSPAMGPGGFDPVQGIPPQMMYPGTMPMMMTPGEQAQVQLSQQMSQFMQMQMQFMQMMASNNSSAMEPPRSAGHVNSQSLNQVPTMSGGGLTGLGMGMDMNPGVRGSYLETPMLDAGRPDMHGRTMSMVQPSSASWLQPVPTPGAGYAGSIRGQGYAPSIAPSERSNIGLPGRYRPVSHMPAASTTTPDLNRKSYMSGAMNSLGENKMPNTDDKRSSKRSLKKEEADDDDDEGWAAMQAKRDQKKSTWRLRKTLAPGDLDIGSLIT
ncbi:hypothetical protein M406DRAFT_341546 [Cryphonectria parasitica EP155]|uniref:Uncharacterized protein n=1 Tax=Cryphonectria parasitica (strain ATCC 38755 / EP155) TaxID=660469 RepID=A0A9P4XWQ3_CRYP1|nr:uncharacterized protein M406DRAFT_341546 [Cryphonectria parasitica EP155]KAF3762308.1 hypothetical protein M406DRAFT_341546 [Cryphonectria parasitica EP155]